MSRLWWVSADSFTHSENFVVKVTYRIFFLDRVFVSVFKPIDNSSITFECMLSIGKNGLDCYFNLVQQLIQVSYNGFSAAKLNHLFFGQRMNGTTKSFRSGT